MTVEIITPESHLYEGKATLVTLPGTDGSLGIMKNHAAMITSLKAGVVKVVEEKGVEKRFELKGGTVEVLNDKVIILAD